MAAVRSSASASTGVHARDGPARSAEHGRSSVNAVVLSGGSAFGLDAAQGAVKYLEERSIGWNVGAAGVVPIVPAAILFDLGFGGDASKIRPTADCGYKAATAASNGAGHRRQRRRGRGRHGRQDGRRRGGR